ncbi:4-(cytidine 5'-diphospho)-2-C-methyl-D-erythritol kinase [bacterium]|nr:4-(cytidine 5'-diphospho)-2-C-methyl-D-erythritol kinase [bacterium]
MGLKVLNRRLDGYHEIWTILHQIDLHDRLLMWEDPDFSFCVTTDLPDIPEDESNLCVKAARLLRRVTGCAKGVRLRLEKNIPSGAGLGGGSSDAAAALLGLNHLWQLNLSRGRLLELAASLGSDVPFFILGGVCVGAGRGEILTPVDQQIEDPIVLVCPDVHVSTAWAYKNIENYRLTNIIESIIFVDSLPQNIFSEPVIETLSNDFERVVFKRHPTLSNIKGLLNDFGAYYASMSGSGSSLYGIFKTREKAQTAAAKLESFGRVFLTGKSHPS